MRIRRRQDCKMRKKTVYDIYLGDDLTPSSTDQVQSIVANLKAVIDELGKNIANARSLISELAKLLDETKQCEQSQICRKIKEMLKDKITEGKITEKWIEECLPQEYKRKYVKSELTSLSQDENGTKEKILVDTSGRSSIAKALLSSDTSGSSNNSTEDNNAKFKASKTNQNLLVGSDNQDTSYETDCLRCKELEDALLRASSVVSADKLQNENKTYLIPKEKHDLLMAAMEDSQRHCIVIFDRNGTFVHTEPDVLREGNA
jgi:hypothetical protein